MGIWIFICPVRIIGIPDKKPMIFYCRKHLHKLRCFSYGQHAEGKSRIITTDSRVVNGNLADKRTLDYLETRKGL